MGRSSIPRPIRSTTTCSRSPRGPAARTNTNQFTHMEANFSLFWGLGVHLWVQMLVPDDTPFDQFLEANPDAFMSLGDTSERLLVDDLLNCTTPGPAQLLQRARPVQARSERHRADERHRRGRRGRHADACGRHAQPGDGSRSAAGRGHLLRVEPVAQEPQLPERAVRRLPQPAHADGSHDAVHLQGAASRLRRRSSARPLRASSCWSSRSAGCG